MVVLGDFDVVNVYDYGSIKVDNLKGRKHQKACLIAHLRMNTEMLIASVYNWHYRSYKEISNRVNGKCDLLSAEFRAHGHT